MTPQDNPGYVLVSRELATHAANGMLLQSEIEQLRTAPPGYSLDVVKAAFYRKYVSASEREVAQEGKAFDRWLTEHLKGGSTS
jgi:hypothetical protein